MTVAVSEADASVVNVTALRRSTTSEVDVCCEVKLPVKYDVEAALQAQGRVEVQGLQNARVRIATEEGGAAVNRLQSLQVIYRTSSGPLLVKGKLLSSLQASATRVLSISGDMIQGGSVEVNAPKIECNLQSLHLNSLQLAADDVTLRVNDVTCHTSSIQAEHAHVLIGNYSGGMTWQFSSMSLEVAVPRLHGDSSVVATRGRVSLGCPTEYRYGICVTGQDVCMHREFKEVKCIAADIKDAAGDMKDAAGDMKDAAGDMKDAAGDKGRQRVLAGPSSPLLSVTLLEGRCSLVPWTWPRTRH
ncbi:uncharacterized protein LOC108668765 [Hyalella azteca]|uniref:Uncharacterized protein LOC108668765 n=1 Tax=Hyalella azteca TaxID=294128 RepID=A0A8B7ND31_HYAAZ|nr:uncharacterized protein LOC108668765 [Hyalella azteca]